MKIGIIIVNWNGTVRTIECLASISHLLPRPNRLTVLVDNGSTDGHIDRIEKQFPEVVVVKNFENVGFTGGNNLGMRYLMKEKCSHIWLLNNDTTVEKNALTHLLHVSESYHAGIVGPKIYFTKGNEFHYERYKESDRGTVLWYAGGIIDWNNMYATHRGVDEVDVGQFNEISETDFVTGCSMLIDRSVIEKIGLLDDRYFAYYEDLEYSLRAKQAGFTLYYCPKALVWHDNAGSTSRPGNSFQEYYMTRNRLLVGFTYAPAKTRIALVREAIGVLLRGRAPQRKAISDVLRNHLGKQFVWKNKE